METAALPADAFYIVSLKHTRKDARYITFWRPDNAGYAWPLSWAGKYDRAAVMKDLGYYNRGDDTIAVPCAVVDALAVTPRKGDIDNDAGPVVLNNWGNWKKLMAAVIAPTPYQIRPEVRYFGRNAGKSRPAVTGMPAPVFA